MRLRTSIRTEGGGSGSRTEARAALGYRAIVRTEAFGALPLLDREDGVAADDDGYVAAARALVADPAALAAARAGRRARMAASPACDAPQYAAAVSAMVRDAWRERCAAGR